MYYYSLPDEFKKMEDCRGYPYPENEDEMEDCYNQNSWKRQREDNTDPVKQYKCTDEGDNPFNEPPLKYTTGFTVPEIGMIPPPLAPPIFGPTGDPFVLTPGGGGGPPPGGFFGFPPPGGFGVPGFDGGGFTGSIPGFGVPGGGIPGGGIPGGGIPGGGIPGFGVPGMGVPPGGGIPGFGIPGTVPGGGSIPGNATGNPQNGDNNDFPPSQSHIPHYGENFPLDGPNPYSWLNINNYSMKMKKLGRLKYVDCLFTNGYNLNYVPDIANEFSCLPFNSNINNIQAINFVAAGMGYNNRVGNKIALFKLTLRMMFSTQNFIYTNLMQFNRFAIIYDRSPNGTYPDYNDIYRSVSANNFDLCPTVGSQLNPLNFYRFISLFDKFTINPQNVDTFIDKEQMCVMCDVNLHLLESIYQNSNFNIGDISTGALYIVTFGQQAGFGSNVQTNFFACGTTRVFFYEN